MLNDSTFNCNDVGGMNLAGNTVALTGSDARGNTASCQATVTVLGLFPTVNLEIVAELCGGNPGSITVNLPEVNGQVAYSINGGASW
ncbi:MAG: hypothetical protein RI973_1285 [Bacteroidota bacterium]